MTDDKCVNSYKREAWDFFPARRISRGRPGILRKEVRISREQGRILREGFRTSREVSGILREESSISRERRRLCGNESGFRGKHPGFHGNEPGFCGSGLFYTNSSGAGGVSWLIFPARNESHT